MAGTPPLSPNSPSSPISPKREPSPSDASADKTDKVSRNIFASLQSGFNKLAAVFTPSGKSSPKSPSPSTASSHAEYETYLEALLSRPVIREISQEDLLIEGMGTNTFEDLTAQIIKDLKRNDVIILNGKALELGNDEEDSIVKVL